MDRAWQRAEFIRQSARKALLELDAKERVARAKRARPRRDIERRQFSEGEPVMVWRQGRRGALAKVDHALWCFNVDMMSGLLDEVSC